MSPEPEQLGPHDRLHKNVFEQVAAGGYPVKLNGKTVGTGVIKPDGSIDMQIFDEDAKRLLTDGSVASLSVSAYDNTITAVMNRKKENRNGPTG